MDSIPVSAAPAVGKVSQLGTTLNFIYYLFIFFLLFFFSYLVDGLIAFDEGNWEQEKKRKSIRFGGAFVSFCPLRKSHLIILKFLHEFPKIK